MRSANYYRLRLAVRSLFWLGVAGLFWLVSSRLWWQDSGGDILRVEYLYQDWYDGARLAVDDDSPAYRYALEILEMMSQ